MGYEKQWQILYRNVELSEKQTNIKYTGKMQSIKFSTI